MVNEGARVGVSMRRGRDATATVDTTDMADADDWIAQELRTLDLGDRRLVRRAALILEQQERLGDSNPAVMRSDTALTGLYRFVNNRRFEHQHVLQSHFDASAARCGDQQDVLLVQDTTEVNLTRPQQQVRGAGPLDHDNRRGFYLHPLYAVTAEGLVLGSVDAVVWTRESIRSGVTQKQKRVEDRQTPFCQKESSRWLEMLQSADQLARRFPDTRFLSVADSEADIYELFEELGLNRVDRAINHDLIVRNCRLRAVKTGATQDGAASNNQPLDARLAELPFRFHSQVDVDARAERIDSHKRRRAKPRPARQAIVHVRACAITLKASYRPGGRGDDINLNVVEAVEIDPPKDQEPVRWVLLTTRPVDSDEQVLSVLEGYRRRWDIELLFRTLKSGLRIERLHYETIEAYLKAVSLLLINAYRVERLKSAARCDGQASCETLVAGSFWRAVWLVRWPGRPLPTDPPTVEQFVGVIAELGGYLKRLGSPPGSTTLWRGLQTATSYHEAYLAIASQTQQEGLQYDV